MAICAAAANPTTGRPEKTAGVPEGASEGTAVSSPQGVLTIGISLLVVRFRCCRPRPARYALTLLSQSITSQVRITVQRCSPESPFLGFLSNSHPSTGDCSYRGQEQSAPSRLYLERGFISHSRLPLRAYYSPVCKPVSRLNPRRCPRRRPPRSLGCCC